MCPYSNLCLIIQILNFRMCSEKTLPFVKKYNLNYITKWWLMFIGSAILMPLSIVAWFGHLLWLIVLLPITCCCSKFNISNYWPISFPNDNLLLFHAPIFFCSGILLIFTFPIWILISAFIKISDLFFIDYYKNRPQSYTTHSCWVPCQDKWLKAMPIVDDLTPEIATRKDASISVDFQELVECEVCNLEINDERHIIIFNCGHGCCNSCATQLESCHICRQRICSKIRLFYTV